ncbi:MAG: class I SAM-dependent methyltransferase [Clostridia bacterium]|nr:class I SAM-dependent methyltransferase [Clostridia bacterium]
MSKRQYTSLAGVYDDLNVDFDYARYAEFLSKMIKKYEKTDTSLVLDLACGTGKITFELRSLGYDMTGIDISENMLCEARERCYRENITDILWLCQSMQEFELYGTVDACVCTLDGINYLTDKKDLEKCFSLVHNYLIPDGVFIFDINTPYKFENIYADNSYVLENEGVLCAWQNEYNARSRICKFYLSIFTENDDGTYERNDEVQREKCYSKRQISDMLKKCGFELLDIKGDLDGKNAEDTDEKWYFVARNIK